jgi:hypothetical protein
MLLLVAQLKSPPGLFVTIPNQLIIGYLTTRVRLLMKAWALEFTAALLCSSVGRCQTSLSLRIYVPNQNTACTGGQHEPAG